jgi:hypothetical protein
VPDILKKKLLVVVASTLLVLLASNPAAASPRSSIKSQPALLDAALQATKAGMPGVAEVYFLSFAGDGKQRVFASEVRLAHAALSKRLDLEGRAIELANSPEADEHTLLATRDALRQAIAGLAAKMNLDEDVLLLFLTSHGGKNADLVVEQAGLSLKDVKASDIRAALDESGVRWRIIIVSACYSGSFIDPLKDRYSLIATAARADRSSFGCTDDREMTYFGEALFRDALPKANTVREALWLARDLVAAKEEAEGLEPSEPQIYVGRDMYPKLEQIPLR